MRNRQKNRAKTLSLPYLRKREQQLGKGAPIGEGKMVERETLSLSHLMQMRCTLTDETRPARWNDA